MKLSVTLVFVLYFCVIISKALPAMPAPPHHGADNKLENPETSTPAKDEKKKVDDTNGKPATDKSQTSEASEESRRTEDESDKLIPGQEYSGFGRPSSCPDVVCAPPPTDGNCQTSNDPSLNVMGSIMGPLSECCQLWMCTKADGSFFTHYGITSIAGRAPEFTRHAFSSHFNHGSGFGQLPFSNYVVQTSGNYGGNAGNRGPQQSPQFSAAGFTGQLLTPSLPSLPGFPFPMMPTLQTNQNQQPIFSSFEIFRNRRDSGLGPQSPQNFAQPKQQQAYRPGSPENFRPYPVQSVPQFY